MDFTSDRPRKCATRCADTVHADKTDFHQTIDKAHGRIEPRRYWQTTDIAWFEDKGLWKGLKSFGMVESIRTIKGKNSIERRYYLTSLPLDAQRFAAALDPDFLRYLLGI